MTTTYRTIFSNYQDYLNAQTIRYHSHESDNPKWKEGQSRFIKTRFESMDRSFRILDIACGDGVGLAVFRELGFPNVVGVDCSASKVELAKKHGYRVLQCDLHDLGIIGDETFDIVYSSHTLEHAYQPLVALSEIKRVLIPGGDLVVVLPFPDTGPDDAHGGKYDLGTHTGDINLVIQVFKTAGFDVEQVSTDSFREPELWINARKPGVRGWG